MLNGSGSADVAQRPQEIGPRVKVLIIVSHPVQWNAALYRLYARDPRLDVTVAYCMLRGVEPALDRDFGVEVAWDVPLLDGYRWIVTRNWSLRPEPMRMAGLINPGIWQVIRGGGFDVVIVCGYRGASYWIAGLAARTTGSTLILASDASALTSQRARRWKPSLKRRLLPLVLSAFDGVLVTSSASSRLYRDLGVDAERIFTAPYVVDNDFFASRARESDRNEMRELWGIPEEALVALFCGKLVPWKRPQDLIAAACHLPNVYVVYAGDGQLRHSLESAVSAARMQERTRFLGFVNQSGLPSVYAACDVLVLPSEHEPFGLVVNEAFASGIPAIVTKACGAADDLVDSSTGFVIDVGDVETLATYLSQLRDDRSLRNQLADAARERIATWGPEQNAAAFASACLRLVAQKGRSISHRRGT